MPPPNKASSHPNPNLQSLSLSINLVHKPQQRESSPSPMSLNCLLCEKGGASPDLNQDLHKHQCSHYCGLQRSFSTNLSPPMHNNMRRNSSLERSGCKGRRRVSPSARTLSNKFAKNTVVPSATGEPRLMRCGGMRRDWSFEDPRSQLIARKR